MSKPKVLIFAPREEPPETISALEALGCEIVIGDLDWQLPRTAHEDDGGRGGARRGRADGHLDARTPRSAAASCRRRSGCASSRNTPSASTTSTPRRRPTSASWCATRRPSRTASASPRPRSRSCSRCSRRSRERDADVRAGKWRTPRTSPTTSAAAPPTAFRGQTIGLVGFGRIGTRVAQLLAPWRARIIAYDPYVPPAHFLTHGVQPVDYETLLRESDVVSFHVVLTKETRYMFGERAARADEAERHRAQHRARQGDRREGARPRDRGGPPPRRRHRRLRGGAAADGFAPAQARRPGAALAALGLVHRGRRTAAGRRLGDALGASPRSRAASRTMSTTGTSSRAGRSASAAPA